MDDIQKYIEEHGESLADSAKEVSLAAADFAANLKKLLDKLRAKNATVTRKPNRSQSETDEVSFTIWRKGSAISDLEPNAKADESLADIRESLANEQTAEVSTEINGTDYKISKNRSDGIKIESTDGKLYNKLGSENRYDGKTDKLKQDLPQIENDIAQRFAPHRKRSAQNSDRHSSKTETLYGYDRSGKFVDNKLSTADARAIKSLMEGKEGQILEGDNAKNLLITFGNEVLFETDANGMITHNAYQRDPSLNASYEKKEAKGLNTLESYVNRVANTPDPAVSVNRTQANVAASDISPIAPSSNTAQEINYATPPSETTTKHLVDTLGDKVLKDAFPDTDKKSVRTIEGVKFERSKLENDRYNISIVNADKSKTTIGTLDRQGKFEPDSKVVNNPQVKAATEKVLAARAIEPRIEIERANAVESLRSANNPSLSQENSPKRSEDLQKTVVAEANSTSKAAFAEASETSATVLTEATATSTTVFTQASSNSTPTFGKAGETAFTQASNTSKTAFTQASSNSKTAFTQASDRQSPDRAKQKPAQKKGQSLSP